MTFAKPQKGLVPIGNIFYATPNTPQKPNYSTPFVFTNKPVGIDFDLILDGCNIGVQATGFLLWMALPSFQILLRNPSPQCNPPPIQLEPPPDESGTFIIGYGNGILVIAKSYSEQFNRVGNCANTQGENSVKVTIDSFTLNDAIDIPYGNPLSDGSFRITKSTHEVTLTLTVINSRTYSETPEDNYNETKTKTTTYAISANVSDGDGEPVKKILSYSESEPGMGGLADATIRITTDLNTPHVIRSLRSHPITGNPADNFQALRDFLAGNATSFNSSWTEFNPAIPPSDCFSTLNAVDTIEYKSVFIANKAKEGVKPPPPPPPEKKKMCDCKKELAVLNLLLKKVAQGEKDIEDLQNQINDDSRIDNIENYINQLDNIGSQIFTKVSSFNSVLKIIVTVFSKVL